MALVLADRVRDTTTTTGTGTVTLSGTAPTGYQNFSAIGNGNTCYYTINGGSQWEVGIGTYSSTGPTLSRDTVLSSSNSGSLVSFSAGTKDVFVTYPAGKSVNYDASNNVGIGNTAPGAKLDVTGNIRLSAVNPNIELNNGGAMVYSPAGNTLAFAKGGGPSSPIETMRIDSNSVVGINVVPSAWQSGRNVLQVGSAALDTSASAQVVVSANRYFDGTNDKYINTAAASAYQQLNGAHIWYRASSGTAGANMTLNESARFDTSGNFLLGTSTTKNRLTVTAGANVNSPTLGSAGGIAYFTNPDVSYGLNIGNSAADGRVWLQAQRTDGSATAYNITLNEAGGNVGIGQSSPTTKLWVGSSGSGGSGTATPDAISLGNTFANSAGDAAKTKLRLYQDSSPVYYGFGVSANLMETHVPSAAAMAWYTGNTERMRLTSTGVLGLGISGGDASLHIAGIRGGNGRMTQISTGGTSQDNLNLIASSSGGGADQWFSWGVSSANYFFIQNGTSVGSSGLVVASNNRVGIGISTPSGPLDVRASAGTTAIINSYNDSSSGNVASVFSNLQSNANSTSSYHYAGVTQGVNIWYLYGNGTSSWSSDMRLKKNIETTRDGYLEDLCKLRVVKYNWHTDAEDKPRELGLIAQEVEEVFPGLVEEALHTIDDTETKYKVLKGSVLPYMLLKALQEANAKIDALTARVAQLEGK